MTWYRVDRGNLLSGETVIGPGFSLDAKSTNGADGWQKFADDKTAYAALGLAPKVLGADRIVLDDAITKLSNEKIRLAVVAIRDNDPGVADAVAKT